MANQETFKLKELWDAYTNSLYEVVDKLAETIRKDQSLKKEDIARFYELTNKLSKLSFEYITVPLEENISTVQEMKRKASQEKDADLLILSKAMEATFSWLQPILNELIKERAERWRREFMSGMITGKHFDQTRQQLKRVEELKIEIQDEFVRTFQWLEEKRKAEKRGEETAREMVK